MKYSKRLNRKNRRAKVGIKLDGITGKRINNETIAEKNLREYLEFQKRMKGK